MAHITSQDWVRLEVLLLCRACVLLRKIFKQRWNLVNKGNEWQDTVEFGKTFITGIGQRVYETSGRLQKLTLEEGDVSNWDLYTLGKAIGAIDLTSSKHNLNGKEIENENRKIEQLLAVGESAMEQTEKSMNDELFSNYWNSIEEILVAFGDSKESIEELKMTSTISSENINDSCTLIDKQTIIKVNQTSIDRARELREKAETNKDNNTVEDINTSIELLSQAISLPGLPTIDICSMYVSRSEFYLKFASLIEGEEKATLLYLALKDSKKAINLRPNSAVAHYHAGTSYVEMNKLQKACKYFDLALGLDPDFEEIKTAKRDCLTKLETFNPKATLEIYNKTYNFNGYNGRETYSPSEISHGGTILSPDVSPSVEKLIFFADDDNPVMNVYKAHQFRDGIETQQNYRKAVQLYRRSIKNNNAEAMYNLALLKIEAPDKIRPDISGAIKLLKQAASQSPDKMIMSYGTSCTSNVGVAESEFVLGLLNAEGIGMERNFYSAFVWYQKASEHGNGPAANNLAILFQYGLGTAKDEKKALSFFKLAASRKVPQAMYTKAIHSMQLWDLTEAKICYYQALSSQPSILTSDEREEFEKQIKIMGNFKEFYSEKQIATWEVNNEFCGKNIIMRERLVRMLKHIEPKKMQELLQFFANTEPKSVDIPFNGITYSSRSNSRSTTRERSVSSDISTDFERTMSMSPESMDGIPSL